MKLEKNSFAIAIKYILYVLILIGVIFIGATMLWIHITPYTMKQFFEVLSKILKNAGSYSVLLVGIVITIFFQVYSKEKDLEKEDRIKIGEIGYYTLCFALKDEPYHEEYNGDKLVVEINCEEDYEFRAEEEDSQYFHFMTKFLTSKKKITKLKNIMAFNDEYFQKNKHDILKNYYQYCEKITYCSPLYCATKPTKVLKAQEEYGRNQYFWLLLKCVDEDKPTIKKFWISAITEEGVVLFVKIKARITIVQDNGQNKAKISLLQQTTYYESHNELCVLYR